jgi:uncharacterized protein YbjQ (UPF0145 family)
VARLAAGGIPADAEARLRAATAPAAPFTSDLSVAELAALRQAGVQPVCQVTGSCVYHVGWQYIGSGWFTTPQELTVLSDAYTQARRRACDRMRSEANLAGADAVVGVHVRVGRYDWGADLIEFSLVGTAVRSPALQSPAGVALTNLSGQECALLHRHGHRPCDLVGGSSVFFGGLNAWGQVPATGMGMGFGMGINFEFQGATRTWYAGRHRALEAVRREAAEAGADGVIATRWDQEQRPHPSSENVTGIVYTFHALATAIVSGDAPPEPVSTVIRL